MLHLIDFSKKFLRARHKGKGNKDIPNSLYSSLTIRGGNMSLFKYLDTLTPKVYILQLGSYVLAKVGYTSRDIKKRIRIINSRDNGQARKGIFGFMRYSLHQLPNL